MRAPLRAVANEMSSARLDRLKESRGIPDMKLVLKMPSPPGRRDPAMDLCRARDTRIEGQGAELRRGGITAKAQRRGQLLPG